MKEGRTERKGASKVRTPNAPARTATPRTADSADAVVVAQSDELGRQVGREVLSS